MRKPWSLDEVLQLRKLVKQNKPAHLIARKLGLLDHCGLCKSLSRRGFSEAYAEVTIRPEWRESLGILSLVAREVITLLPARGENYLLNFKPLSDQSV
jgi:hypothetical protein